MTTFNTYLTGYANRIIFGETNSYNTHNGSVTFGFNDAFDVAQSIPARAGWFEILCHGNPEGFATPLRPDGSFDRASPEELAEAIRSHRHYHGQPILLFSCFLARTGFARRLSDLLDVVVEAADDEIQIGVDGNNVPYIKVENNGRWYIFTPRCTDRNASRQP